MGRHRDRERWRWGDTGTRRHRDGEGLRRRERQQEEGGWCGGHGGGRPDQAGESRGWGGGPALCCSSYPLLSPLTCRLSRGLPAPGRRRLRGGRQGAARPREQRTQDFRRAPWNSNQRRLSGIKTTPVGKGSLPTGTEGSLSRKREQQRMTAGEVRALGPRSRGSVSTGSRAGGTDEDQNWGDREPGRRSHHTTEGQSHPLTAPASPSSLSSIRGPPSPGLAGWAWRAGVPARSWPGEPKTEGPSEPPALEPALGTGRPAGLAQRSRCH